MDNREPLLRSDWTIYRGGAIFFNGAEDCSLRDSDLDELGGNAVFVNDYNRRVVVRGCHIAGAGPTASHSSGIRRRFAVRCFSTSGGRMSPASTRRPARRRATTLRTVWLTTASSTRPASSKNRPRPSRSTWRRTSPCDTAPSTTCPAPGINIGDGCWGGHVVEFCDVFDTVKETGDHGSYNSWGRDRYWGLEGIDLNTAIANGST